MSAKSSITSYITENWDKDKKYNHPNNGHYKGKNIRRSKHKCGAKVELQAV